MFKYEKHFHFDKKIHATLESNKMKLFSSLAFHIQWLLMQGERKKVQIFLLVHKMPFSGEQIVKVNKFILVSRSVVGSWSCCQEEIESERVEKSMCVHEKNFKHVHTIKASMIDCWLLKTNYRSGAKCAYTDNIYKSFLFLFSTATHRTPSFYPAGYWWCWRVAIAKSISQIEEIEKSRERKRAKRRRKGNNHKTV